MGADTLLVCRLPGITESLTVKVPGLQRFTDDSLVGLQWSTSRQYLFSTTSGQRCVAAEHPMLLAEKKYAV